MALDLLCNKDYEIFTNGGLRVTSLSENLSQSVRLYLQTPKGSLLWSLESGINWKEFIKNTNILDLYSIILGIQSIIKVVFDSVEITANNKENIQIDINIDKDTAISTSVGENKINPQFSNFIEQKKQEIVKVIYNTGGGIWG